MPARQGAATIHSTALPGAGQQPAGRLPGPAEVAAVLEFLAGRASSGMTGAVGPVDGGLAL